MAKSKNVAKVKKEYPKTEAGKKDRFTDSANARVPRAIKAIRAVGKLAVSGVMSYSTEDAQKICAALAAEYNRVKSAFETGKVSKDELFKL